MPLKIDNSIAISLSLRMIEDYCKKDIAWIPLHFDERTFFIGPRNGQILRSKTAIMNAWISNHAMPDFSVSEAEASSVITSATTCEVLLHYNVTWHKKDGSVMEHPQVMQLSWFLQQTVNGSTRDSERHEHYKVAVMHISNPEELDERDLVYNTFGDIATSSIGHSIADRSGSETWIIIPGTGSILNHYPAGSIIWIDSAEQGHQSLVHTRDREIRSSRPLSYYMKEYPEVFLKPSVSFLVNPAFIKTISRFQIELWDGHILHVPEKKYGAFKKKFEEYAARQHS